MLATPNHGILQRDKTRMNITTPPSPTTAPSGVGNYGMSLTAGNHAPGSADAFASQLIEKNTSPLGFFGQARQLDTASLANQVVALSQKDSAEAADVLAAVEQQLSPSDFSNFQADLRTAREQLENGVATLKGNGGSEHSAIDKDAARNLAEKLVQDASTEQASTGNSQGPADIDTSELAFRLEKLAEADPAEAQAVKAALNELLPLDQLAALNEDLGGGRSLTERLALIVESPGDAAVGVGKGVATDASDDMEFKLKVFTNLVGTKLQVDSMLMKGRDPEASAGLMQQAEAMYRKTDDIDLPAPEIKNGAEAGGRDLASVAEIVTGDLSGLAKGKTLDGLGPKKPDPSMKSDLTLSVPDRIARLELEGHAPIRHGGPNRVTDVQLEDRAVRGIDPASGTTMDAFAMFPDGTPRPHKVGRNATAFSSDEALVKADDFARNSQQFQQNVARAQANGDPYVAPVELSLQDVFGSNYLEAVRGVARVGSPKNPTGHIPIDFTDGTIKAIFKLDNDGNASLVTLYPEPNLKKSNEPN